MVVNAYTPARFARKMGKVAWDLEKTSIRKLVDEAAAIGAQAAREKSPVRSSPSRPINGRSPGALRRSVSIDRSIAASKAYARFGWSAEHAPMIIPGRRRSKSKRKGVFFGSTQTGRGNIAFRVRRTVDQRLGHLSDQHVKKAL